MKKKKVMLSIITIFIVSILLVVIIKNNTKEYIMYDGALLALTLDGNAATSFPSNTNKYHVDIECDNGIGEYLPDDDYNLKFTIKNITEDGAKCFIDFTTITDSNKSEYLINDVVKNSGTKIESTNNTGETDTSYRYTGKTPNNYVWFNNELWRIIGLIPVCLDSGCGNPTTSLVKIIRNESMSGVTYDAKLSNGTGCWGANTLYSLLNNAYYGKVDAMNSAYCYGYYNTTGSPKADCDYSVIGISSDPNDYYGKMVKKVFWNVGASNYLNTTKDSYKYETAKQNVSGKIGLMSASDYGYAGENYTSSMYNNEFANSVSQNWIYGEGNEFTSTWYSDNYVIHIDRSGIINGGGNTNSFGESFRPVLYLDSNVYIISGKGTESNPYILGM